MKTRKVIDGNNFRTQLAKLMPNYTMGMDNDGQIIIYTNLRIRSTTKQTEVKLNLSIATTVLNKTMSVIGLEIINF